VYNNIMATTIIQVRRDTAANWTSNNPILATGELGFETDTGLFKIGRNDTDWTSLAYAQVAGPTGPVGETGLTGATGPKGDPGDDGADGAPGMNGADGAPGISGSAGAEGPPGPPGEDGVPGEPANIQNLKFTLNPLVNPNDFGSNGYWTNNTTSAQTYTNQVDPADFSIYTPDLLVIEKTSTTSSIEIEFDVTINLNYEQNVSAFVGGV
jgi:hypothetical protein